MANKKNKINALVTDDDDPTAELQVLAPDPSALHQDADPESEAKTSDFARTDATADGHDASISDLQSDLRLRSETISGLQYDIEQLRAKWLGLETEIQAREELTESLNQELAGTKRSLGRKENQVKKRDQSIKSLKAEIRQRDSDYRSLRESSKTLQRKVDQATTVEDKLKSSIDSAAVSASQLDSELQQLRNKNELEAEADEQLLHEANELRQSFCESQQAIADLRQYIDGRHSDWEIMRVKLAQQDELTGQLGAEQETLRAEVKQRQRDVERLNADLTSRDEAIRNLRNDSDVLQRELDAHRGDGTETLKHVLSEQAGQLASSEMTIKDLRKQIDRTESYADSIRRQLHDLVAQHSTTTDAHDFLQQSLNHANGKLVALQDSIEDEKRNSTKLKNDLDKAQETHAVELRTIRYELGEAEETLAQHESVSEQLASDLVDTREFRDELEIMLGDNEQQSTSRIEKLTKQNRKLERQIEAFEQKLETKGEAVNCLLEELARKNKQIESIDQIEEVIHEIDDRMSNRIDERPAGGADRITRFLIGSIDGQELRFPLFKNRLTIGRTEQNDIQLEAPYISRRHAVIVTDGNMTRIVDWGSKNGVSVNDSRITEHFLKNGDTVTIGTANFRYEERPKRER